jgi:NACalpha-BTF3-like transcription factor
MANQISADQMQLEESDIALVVSQTGASRLAAINALHKYSGDIIDAIIELTMVEIDRMDENE